MAGICLPIDASGGAPAFPAAQHRAAQSALMTGSPSRPLGARSGVRPTSVPTLTLSGLNWSLSPFNGVLDPGTSLAVGPYLFAFLANETGSLNAQDATYPRIDRIDVQVPDDPPNGLPLAAVIKYTAGTPASSPVAPSAPAQSLPLGTFSVPKSGSGNPSFTASIPMAVAAGGILPVAGPGAYPASPYKGQYIDDAALGLLRWDGTKWSPYGLGGVNDQGGSGYIKLGSVLLQWGAVSVSTSAAAAGTAAVTFPIPFGGTPRVTATPTGASQYPPSTSAVGANGFTMVIRQIDQASSTVTISVPWMAVGLAP